MNAIKATIKERGNGFPDVGDYVGGGGYLYRVLSLDGPIHTGNGAGAANYIHATVEEADWEDCAEGDEGPGEVVIAPEDGPEET